MSDGWTLSYKGFEPEQEALREALCTLGNGRFAIRGAAEESSADEVHYPGTYLAGGYNRLTSDVAGRDIVNEDLVNFPNWLPLSFRPAGGAWLGEEDETRSDYRQVLDLRHGVLHRSFVVRDGEGRETRVATRRFVHMDDPHLGAIEQEIEPLNWSGSLEIRSGLDGGVTNWGVARYRELRGDHLETLDAGSEEGTIYLHSRTKQSRIEVAIAARTRVLVAGEPTAPPSPPECTGGAIRQTIGLEVEAGGIVHVEKTVALYTSRDPAVGDLVGDALLKVERAAGFDALLDAHRAAWATLWARYDVEVEVAREADASPHSMQQILRLHTFHLLQTVSPHTVGFDAGVPARGLHGEAYRGHIFWDEMYILPFYLQRDPELARSLLMYRYRRLDEARALAAEAGFRGAMFPWQSGSSGREETQIIHLNPRSGTWDPDHSHLQRHVSAAIAKNVWAYVRATGDHRFLAGYGAEIVLEIARFWASFAQQNERGTYEIVGVIGPDEFHEAYPGAEKGGLRNNAYTNIMAAWCIETALELLGVLDEVERAAVVRRIGLTDEEIGRWHEVVHGIRIPVLPNGLIEQFEGYGELEELDWDRYRAEYGSIGRLDRILKAEGDSPDHYKLSKQADLCMLFYVFDTDELAELLARSGYELTEEKRRRMVEYYRQRTSHGSTLSHLVFAAILDDLDRTASWGHFVEAVRSDVGDVQGGTTPEGIHAAVMAGTIRHVIERFAGVRLSGEALVVDPRLVDGIERVRFSVCWEDTLVSIDVDRHRVRIAVPAGARAPVPVRIDGVGGEARPGEPMVVASAGVP